MTLISRSICFIALISFTIQNHAQNIPILVDLAKEQKWDELASLLEDGLNPNVIYGDGTTALHWASYHNSEDAIENANLAAIRMVVLNDGNNTENNKLTLMNYAKKVYGDFDTGINPKIYNNYAIFEKGQNIVIYKRLYNEEGLIDEEIYQYRQYHHHLQVYKK